MYQALGWSSVRKQNTQKLLALFKKLNFWDNHFLSTIIVYVRENPFEPRDVASIIALG